MTPRSREEREYIDLTLDRLTLEIRDFCNRCDVPRDKITNGVVWDASAIYDKGYIDGKIDYRNRVSRAINDIRDGLH